MPRKDPDINIRVINLLFWFKSDAYSANNMEARRNGNCIGSSQIRRIIQVRGITAKRTDAIRAIVVLYRRSAILNKRKVSNTARIPIIILGTVKISVIEEISVVGCKESGYPIMPRIPAKNSWPK